MQGHRISIGQRRVIISLKTAAPYSSNVTLDCGLARETILPFAAIKLWLGCDKEMKAHLNDLPMDSWPRHVERW